VNHRLPDHQRSRHILSPFQPWIAALVALLIATFVGWLHGVLIARSSWPFIVTFGSLSLLRGLAQVISNGPQ